MSAEQLLNITSQFFIASVEHHRSFILRDQVTRKADRFQQFSTAGFREQFGPGRICAIEWPEKAGDRLPGADLTITLQVDGDGRLATLVAVSSLGHACLASALKEFDTTAVA